MYSAGMFGLFIRFVFLVAGAGALLVWPNRAVAHASEQGFVLLLPTGAYILSGTIAVIASILLVSVLTTRVLDVVFRPVQFGQGLRFESASGVCSFASALVFLTLIGIGLFGPTDPQGNLLVLTIWNVFWVAFFMVQGLLFDVWRWVNPWFGLHRLVMGDAPPIYQLPTRLGAWPAVVLFLMFQIFAVADIAPSDPTRLAKVAVSYWIFTFLGMLVFGFKAWSRQVECFSVLFRLIGSLRMVQLRGGFRIGAPGWRVFSLPTLSVAHAVFCLSILASGSFDGLDETFWWLAKIGINPLEFPGRSAVVWTSTFGLLAANFALIGIFALAVWVGVRCVGADFKIAFCAFSVAILPIALGYHFAHFLVSFLVQIQYVFLALGDPFAQGWNLFGLSNTNATTGFLKNSASVKTIWLTQAGAVVMSHVLSVIMTHHTAGNILKRRKEIFIIQVGLSALMIAYTVFGLWLLASPRGM